MSKPAPAERQTLVLGAIARCERPDNPSRIPRARGISEIGTAALRSPANPAKHNPVGASCLKPFPIVRAGSTRANPCLANNLNS
jgi:hypothetical protein